MTRKEKACFVVDKLEELFPDVKVPLKHKDTYTLLIAVVLSAQCTDKRVNEVTPVLFGIADTPEKMASLSFEKIEEAIRPCGLYRAKARAVRNLSRILIERHAGNVPGSFEELESLPGVGHKTASVMMIQAFGKPAFPVDTHIHRLMHRWGLSDGRHVEQTELDCKRLFPTESWRKLHLQIIYFGRKYCPSRGHKPQQCPICSKVGKKK